MPRLQEVRENPNTLVPEITPYDVPECLASLIDKKVAFDRADESRRLGNNVQVVALNCIEAFVHWLLTWLYTPYNTLYELKTVIGERDYQVEAISIHRFRDGTPLFNLSGREIGISHRQEGADRMICKVNGVAYPILFFQGEQAEEIPFSQENSHHLEVTLEAPRANNPEVRTWIFHSTMLGRERGGGWILDPGPMHFRANESVIYARPSEDVRERPADRNAVQPANPAITLDPNDLRIFGPIFQQKYGITSFSRVPSAQGLKIFNATGRPVEHVKVSDKQGERHVLKLSRGDGKTYPVMGLDGKKPLELFQQPDGADFVLITELPSSNSKPASYLIRESQGGELVASYKHSIFSGKCHWATIEGLGD